MSALLGICAWLAAAQEPTADPFAALRERCAAVLAPVVAEADVTPAVRVERLDGSVVFERRGAEPFVIASNMKLFTTAAALLALGPEYRWTTTATLADGRLYLTGRGDPSLRRIGERDVPAAFLDALAQALRRQQIARLDAVVLDARAFAGPAFHPQWPEDQWQAEYCAPVSALSLEGGCLEIVEAGGSLEFQPPARSAFRVERKSPADAKTWTASWTGARDTILVRGAGHGKGALRLAVADPLAIYGAWLRDGLAARGIEVGTVRPAAADESLPGAEALLIVKSAWTLGDVVVVCNKESDNYLAEVLLRTLGLERRRDGSTAAGIAVVREVLTEAGLDLSALAQADGSGMARSAEAPINSSSPALLCALLRRMTQPDAQHAGRFFFDSLPVGGVEARLREWFRDEVFQPQRVRAKTGWIRGASSLAGYLLAPDGEILTFAIVVNYAADGTPRTNNSRFRQMQADLLEAVLRAWPEQN